MTALILALNPSIDAEWRVDDVLWEEKNNVQSERRWAGGKGINVARWLKHLGAKPKLILPLGGNAGRELASHLRDEKIPAHVVPLHEPTRVNIIVTTRVGRQMRFNPLGPKISRREWAQIIRVVESHLKRPAQLLVLSGSLPRGVPVTAYSQIIRLAREYGVRTVLDCDGPPFAAGIKARPFLVKPNEHELALWAGQKFRSEHELVQAAKELSGETRGWVFVSRGANGGLLVNVAGNFEKHAKPPRVKVRNTVGAGDALLAAVAHQILSSARPEEWLRCGLATGSAAAALPPGHLPPHRRQGR